MTPADAELLALAVLDATQRDIRNPDRMDGVRTTGTHYLCYPENAERWVEESELFDFWCRVAGLDPDLTRSRMLESAVDADA